MEDASGTSFFIGLSERAGRKNKSFNRPTASDQVEASLRSGWDKCFITSSEERTNPMTWTSSAIMKRLGASGSPCRSPRVE